MKIKKGLQQAVILISLLILFSHCEPLKKNQISEEVFIDINHELRKSVGFCDEKLKIILAQFDIDERTFPIVMFRRVSDFRNFYIFFPGVYGALYGKRYKSF